MSAPQMEAELVARFEVASALFVPLAFGGEVRGAVVLITETRREFADDEVQLAYTLANEASAGLSVLEAKEQLSARADHQEALVRAAQTLNAQLDIRGVLDTLCKEADLALGGDLAGFYLKDAAGNGVATAAHNLDEDSDWFGYSIRPGEGVAGRVLESGEPAVPNAHRAEARVPSPGALGQIETALSVPCAGTASSEARCRWPSGPCGVSPRTTCAACRRSPIFGGDEFVLVLPAADEGQALAAADRLRRVVRETGRGFGEVGVAVSASAGVAQWREPMTAAELIDRADRALLLAKHHGKDETVAASTKTELELTVLESGNGASSELMSEFWNTVSRCEAPSDLLHALPWFLRRAVDLEEVALYESDRSTPTSLRRATSARLLGNPGPSAFHQQRLDVDERIAARLEIGALSRDSLPELLVALGTARHGEPAKRSRSAAASSSPATPTTP